MTITHILVTSHIYLVGTQVKVLRPFGQKVEGGLELEAVPEQVDPGKDVETWKILIVNNSKILRGNLWYVKKTTSKLRCLMGSQIMGSIGFWDQIYPNGQVPNNCFIPNFSLKTN